MKKKSQYIAILDGDCLLVELTDERWDVIENKYDGDMEMYVYDALSEEFGFYASSVDWMHVSDIKCAGEIPQIQKIE